MGKQVLRMKYHPAKKEVAFERYQSEKLIPIKGDSVLTKYTNKKGQFVLQDHGDIFFDHIVEAFDGESVIDIDVITTKTDYEDFEQMAEYYNQCKDHESKINPTLLAELPDMETTFLAVKKHGDYSIDVLQRHLKHFWEVKSTHDNVINYINSFTQEVKKEINNIEEKISSLGDNNVKLCFAGVYSSGKSALINAIIGYRILPESIKSETAKMFCIQSPQKETPVRIVFAICNTFSELQWNNKTNRFMFTAGEAENESRKKIQQTINANEGIAQHVQLYNILSIMNVDINIATEIKIFFPIPLDNERVQFTIYDTPGTDSNYDQHKIILENALSSQTHSILMFIVAPNKTEGEGNNALLSYLKTLEQNNTKTSIDLARSLFVMNWADTLSPDRLKEAQSSVIKQFDENSDSPFVIQLSDKKLFFVSALYAYAGKAKENKILHKDSNEEFYLQDRLNSIQNEKHGRFYQYNKYAMSQLATKNQLKTCEDALKAANGDIPRIFNICSGLYALEYEVVRYAEKYAASVRTFAIIDSIERALAFLNKESMSIKSENKKDIKKIDEEINNTRFIIEEAINEAYKKHELTNKIKLEKLNFLNLDLESRRTNIIEKILSFIEKRLNLAFGFLVKNVKYSQKDKEKIWKNISVTINDYTNNFIEKRKQLLVNTRDSFIKEVKDIIIKNGSLSKEAEDYMLQISPPELIPVDINKVGDVYDTQKRMDKFLFWDIEVINKESYFSEIKLRLNNTAQDMADDYFNDYSSELKRILNCIKIEFINNLEKYSILIKAKLKDKEAMMVLSEKIDVALDDLKQLQNELNNTIWNVNHD